MPLLALSCLCWSCKQATQNIINKLGSAYLDLLLLHAPFLPAGVDLEKVRRFWEARRFTL